VDESSDAFWTQERRDGLAAALAAWISARGVRKAVLARETGVARGTLDQVLKAKTNPRLETLARAAEYLGTSAGALVDGVLPGADMVRAEPSRPASNRQTFAIAEPTVSDLPATTRPRVTNLIYVFDRIARAFGVRDEMQDALEALVERFRFVVGERRSARDVVAGAASEVASDSARAAFCESRITEAITDFTPLAESANFVEGLKLALLAASRLDLGGIAAPQPPESQGSERPEPTLAALVAQSVRAQRAVVRELLELVPLSQEQRRSLEERLGPELPG
jgi:transcriptional regulator with XRE-family HTH domain